MASRLEATMGLKCRDCFNCGYAIVLEKTNGGDYYYTCDCPLMQESKRKYTSADTSAPFMEPHTQLITPRKRLKINTLLGLGDVPPREEYGEQPNILKAGPMDTAPPTTISLIVACSTNRIIGKDGALPWKLRKDLKRFRHITMGKPIIMGRKTHESIGRALPGRLNIILTHQVGYQAPNCKVVHSKEEALRAAQGHGEVMVIGGEKIYQLFLSDAQYIYLTWVKAQVEGDTLFPELDPTWQVTGKTIEGSADDNNEHDYSFLLLEKKRHGTAEPQPYHPLIARVRGVDAGDP